MIKRSIILVLVVGLVFCAGCGTRKIVTVHLEGNKKVDLMRGQLLKVEIEENPTTGYIWRASNPGGSNAVQIAGPSQYLPGSALVGAGGIRTFRFKALKRGKAEIRFEYRRPWEEYRPPAKKYRLILVVH